MGNIKSTINPLKCRTKWKTPHLGSSTKHLKALLFVVKISWSNTSGVFHPYLICNSLRIDNVAQIVEKRPFWYVFSKTQHLVEAALLFTRGSSLFKVNVMLINDFLRRVKENCYVWFELFRPSIKHWHSQIIFK